MPQTWSETDFDRMSWHDNSVHGISIVEGQHGSGELILELDYILEWLPARDARMRFRIAPAVLRFHEATNLRISLDYATATAALTPFSVHRIGFEPVVYGSEARSKLWIVEINWPAGEITFQSPGYTQTLVGEPVVIDGQRLSFEQRERLKIATPTNFVPGRTE